ncbi:unnamed protein product [Mytilus coruscus]|uniref:Uncharacterized protein n=1 Tax=Mytilus coruscus TaxID=42192 RepID=A0A6J8D3T9_MYTCO|nr:unnamed protein product [Mytilus coruscus]
MEHIDPVTKCVLSLADIHISTDELPSKSTAAKLTSELGIIARNHIKEELASLTNITMQRDATTKKGRHVVGLELSTGDKILTAGLREVENGMAITYVDFTKKIIKDFEDTTETHDNILPKVLSFMTDRIVTEQKAKEKKHLLQLSGKVKQFDVTQPSKNLLQFIQNEQIIPSPSTQISKTKEEIFEQPESLLGKKVKHIWTDNGKDEECHGSIHSYNSGIFEVQYNDIDANNNKSNLYDLTTEEIRTDYAAGFLFCFRRYVNKLLTMIKMSITQ